MEENKTYVTEFGDGLKITRETNVIDVSRLGYFDELEEEAWYLILKYMKAFDITIDEDSEGEADFYSAKEVQERILKLFEEAGFKFKFEKESEV